MIKISKCLECRLCCKFENFGDRLFSEKSLFKHFSFTKNMCDTFFFQVDNKYKIGESCKHSYDGKCDIYDHSDFPFTCAIYPFFLAIGKKGNYKLVLDRNCPSWREAISEKENIYPIIKKYSINNALETFNEKDLIRMGYKIVTIIDDISITD